MSHISNQAREIYKLAVGMFAAAPGTVYFDSLNSALEGGMSLTDVYRALADNPAFQAQNFAFQPQAPNAQFANAFLDRLLGSDVSAQGRSIAFSFVFDRLQAGISRGDVIQMALDALDGVPVSNPDFGAAASRFQNRVEVAKYFTEETKGSSTDIGLLQSTLATVTSDPLSRDAAIDLFPGISFLLTPGRDSGPAFTGANGGDLFSAPISTDPAAPNQQTLTTIDALQGGGGIDTLDAVIQTQTARPSLANIENVQVRFVGPLELNLGSATGVQQVTVQNSSAAGVVTGLDKAATLAVRHQNQSVTFEGENSRTLSLTIEDYGQATAPGVITIGRNQSVTLDSVELALDDAYAQLKSFTFVPLISVAIHATGANAVTLGSGMDTVRTLVVNGSGSVDLSRAVLKDLTTLVAGDATGGIALNVDDTATTIALGSGADALTYTAPIPGGAQISLGAGDDLIVLSGLTLNASIAGGPGNDALKFANGDWLDTAANAFYTGFETLEVGGGQGMYVMSRLPSLHDVDVSNVAPKADINIVDAPAGVTLTLTSQASQTLSLTKQFSVALADASGAADTVHVVLNAVDGNNDQLVQGSALGKMTPSGNIEVVDITSNVLQPDVTLSADRYSNSLDIVAGHRVNTVTVHGDARLSVSFDASTTSITTIDASQSSGGIAVSVAFQPQAVTFRGSSGADTYDATTHGDLINTGLGGDTIRLSQTGAVDRLVYSAGDSQLTSIAAQYDTISNFGATTDASGRPVVKDLIDLTAFDFTAGQSSALVDKGSLDPLAVNGTTLFQADWFMSGGEEHAVAIGTRPAPVDPRQVDPRTPITPFTSYVFVDVDKDGDFDAANDLFIALTGVQDVSINNFVF